MPAAHRRKKKAVTMDESSDGTLDTNRAYVASRKYTKEEKDAEENRKSGRKRPALTLRVVISLLTALIVLVVAAATFSITYTQGLASSEALGERLTTTLATAAMIRIEERFDVPAQVMGSVYQQFQREGMMLPSDSADPMGVLTRFRDTMLTGLLTLSGGTLSGFLMDDGSSITLQKYGNATHPNMLFSYRGSAKNVDPAVGCCHDYIVDEFDLSDSMRRYPTSVLRNPLDNVNRLPIFQTGKCLLQNSPTATWQNVQYVDAADPPVNAIPTLRAMRRASHSETKSAPIANTTETITSPSTAGSSPGTCSSP